MGIVSIGEVVGSVQGGPSEPEQPPAEEALTGQESAVSPATRAEEISRELRVRAWRQTRLQAD